MITLITSNFQDDTPDRKLLQDFEQFCARNSSWVSKQGPLLFSPGMISSRLYTALHFAMCPVLKIRKVPGAIISFGLPYRNYLYSKNFPYFSFTCDLRVLWTYDVWEPRYQAIEKLVRQSSINLLLLSSRQATEHFQSLSLNNCTVAWVPETVNTDNYKNKPWLERKINILSFGRSYAKYHDKIVEGCLAGKINYIYQELAANTDVATHGLKTPALQFPTEESFINGLADAQICICFPRALTHPQLAGNVSTLTLRYLQAMASKCLVLGTAPLDAEHIFGYNPVVEVDWNDPVGQILEIIQNFSYYQNLVEKNYNFVHNNLHYANAMATIDRLARKNLEGIRKLSGS